MLVALAAHGDKDGRAYPSVHTLARLTGRSRRAVTRALMLLRDQHHVIAGELTAKKAAPWTSSHRRIWQRPGRHQALDWRPPRDHQTPHDLDPKWHRTCPDLVPNWLPPGRHTKWK